MLLHAMLPCVHGGSIDATWPWLPHSAFACSHVYLTSMTLYPSRRAQCADMLPVSVLPCMCEGAYEEQPQTWQQFSHAQPSCQPVCATQDQPCRMLLGVTQTPSQWSRAPRADMPEGSHGGISMRILRRPDVHGEGLLLSALQKNTMFGATVLYNVRIWACDVTVFVFVKLVSTCTATDLPPA